MQFSDNEALARLESMEDGAIDALPCGVVGLSLDGTVERYNAYEREITGLSEAGTVGSHFFSEVAPCMNNFLVAQKLLDEPHLDETLPYVLTIRMRPTKVQLRLLKRRDCERMYVLIRREG